MPLTVRDHLASIYCMLILGIDLPTASRPMTFMVSFILSFKIPRISVLLFSLFESVKIGRHSFLFYCVLALAGYFVIFAHSFLILFKDPVHGIWKILSFTLSFSF